MSNARAARRGERQWRGPICATVAVAVALLAGGGADAQTTTQPAASTPATRPALPQTQPGLLPHLRVDRQQRFVDLDAKVIVRDAKWLELLACSPRSREHESLLTIEARPSHIHLALLMIGLEPGSPLAWQREGDKAEVFPPRGPRVAVTLRYEKEGKTVEVPANQWVVNQRTRETLADNVWLFSGSKVVEFEGQTMFLADANGTVISLVNFGDDLLTRDTKLTNQTDDATWGCNTDAIPPVGTAVTVRIRPAGPATQPATGAATRPATAPAKK